MFDYRHFQPGRLSLHPQRNLALALQVMPLSFYRSKRTDGYFIFNSEPYRKPGSLGFEQKRVYDRRENRAIETEFGNCVFMTATSSESWV